MEIKDCYNLIKNKFIAKNIDESDAYALFDYFYGKDFIVANHVLNKKEINKLLRIANKRIKTHEPIFSIINFSPFYGRFFKTNKHVLKPRLDTEILLNEALKLSNNKTKILDLCCGSGILGITLNLEKLCKVLCADISNFALAITRKNAKALGANISAIKSDMFKNIQDKFDIIVANPPYIKTNDIESLDSEVKNFDPKLALDGGDDGLKFYKIIASEFEKYLSKDGTLLLEIGFNQKNELLEIFSEFDVKVIKDFNNLDRVLIVKIKE